MRNRKFGPALEWFWWSKYHWW